MSNETERDEDCRWLSLPRIIQGGSRTKSIHAYRSCGTRFGGVKAARSDIVKGKYSSNRRAVCIGVDATGADSTCKNASEGFTRKDFQKERTTDD